MHEHDIPYLDALRDQLVRSVAMRQRRQKRRRQVFRATVVIAVVAAAATSGVSLLGGRAGGESADAAVLRHVRAVIAPTQASILYVQAVATLDGSRVDYQSWQLSTTPYSFRRIKGPTETSFNGTTIDSYDAATNTISEQPASEPQSFDDPVAELRQLLANGQARIVQKTTLSGRSVYQIDARSDGAVLNGTIYVDVSSYAPVRAELAAQRSCPSDSCVGPETIDFLAYQQLSPTADNLKLLSVTARHPQARIVTTPAPTTTGASTTTTAPKSAPKPPASPAPTTTSSTNG